MSFVQPVCQERYICHPFFFPVFKRTVSNHTFHYLLLSRIEKLSCTLLFVACWLVIPHTREAHIVAEVAAAAISAGGYSVIVVTKGHCATPFASVTSSAPTQLYIPIAEIIHSSCIAELLTFSFGRRCIHACV